MKLAKFFLSILIPISVQAASTPASTEQKTNPPIVINPSSLRELVLNSGLSILEAVNRVHVAKENVALARTRLLPSVSLGMIASAMANPAFLIGSVEYTLPFLIPSKWFDLAEAKKLSKAEKEAFLTSELNLYASYYSIYLSIINDIKTRDFLAEALKDAILIEHLVERNIEDGRATENDLNSARAQTAHAMAQLNSTNELIVEEISQLRKALNQPLEQAFDFDYKPTPSSSLELQSLNEAYQVAVSRAPEVSQINWLLEATVSEKWSKIFAFISSFSVSSGTFGGRPTGTSSSVTGLSSPVENNFAFSGQSSSSHGMFTFSFEYFPNISLTNRHREQIQIRQQDLLREIQRLTESTLGKFQYISNRFDVTSRSRNLLQTVFVNEQKKYSIGEASLNDLLEINTRLREAGLNQLRAETDLQLVRVSLHRLARTDEFANFKGCEALPAPGEQVDKFHWPWEDKPQGNICDTDAVKKRFGN